MTRGKINNPKRQRWFDTFVIREAEVFDIAWERGHRVWTVRSFRDRSLALYVGPKLPRKIERGVVSGDYVVAELWSPRATEEA